MRRRPLRASGLLIAILLMAAAGPAAGKEKVTRIAGVGRDPKGKPTPVEILTASDSGLRISIGYLEPAAAGKAIGSILGESADIFRAQEEGVRGHLVFVLQIDNDSRSDVIYQPGQGRLITDRHDAEFPMDYTMLHRLLTTMPGGAPELEEVERAVFSRATTVRPGGSVRKLLVFEGPRNRKFKKLEVRIGALHLEDRELDPRFRFRRFEVKS